MNETRRLAEWVVDLTYDSIPRQVVEAARLYVLDDLASGFAGAKLPWTRIVSDLSFGSSTGQCSVFASKRTTSGAAAALINGVAVGGFETDHPFTAGSCHPSGAVFPAVLAASEVSHVDGRTFLSAIVAGYEALCRIGLAATRAVEDERGFHGPGTNAPLGGAIGAGKVFGLDSAEMVNAIGIAASHGAGLLEFHREGAMTKRLHLGRGSQLGLESTLLALRGFTGPSTALEGDHGFLRVYSPKPRVDELLQDLGTRFRMLGVTIKAYPCHVSFHALIDALIRFKQNHAIDPESVTAVEIVGQGRIMEERFGARSVDTLMGAQYSMPWSCALTLCYDTSNPATWSEESLHDPLVAKLAANTQLRLAPPSQAGSVADVIVHHGGQRDVIVATDWKGAPSNPCTFDEMARKFERYTTDVISADHAEEVIDRVENLEKEDDVSRLISLIRA